MSDQIGTASIGLAVDSSGVDAGLNRMEATVEQVGRTLSTLGRRGTAAVGDIGTGASAAATNTERATRRIESELQRVTAAAGGAARGTREFYESLASQRGADLNRIRPLLDQLDQVRSAQATAAAASARSGQAFASQGQSAAALAASLRQVPAQLTDIVTSLQGGQAPLTVFLQQGGQLRDMFGSAGGAARALGGYLVSLVNPFTVAAVAAVALGVAYNQGSKEADAFRKSIILTGNAAGTTTSQLANMAKQASDVAGTQGANAEALAQLVGTGKVGADQLLAASITAVQSQKYLGIAVEDTVKAFADLGKDPLQATLKFNEQYNYLTLATYKQIKALTDQARTSDAAKVAQVAYGDAIKQKSKEVADEQGALQKSWTATGDAAKWAWDKMLNIGRESSIDDKIKAAQDALKKAEFARYSFSGGTAAEKDADRDEAQRQVDRLQNIKKVGEIKAQYEAQDAKSRDAAIKFDQEGEQFLTRRQKLEKEIAAARNLGQQAAQRGEDPAVTEKNIQDRIVQIRQSYAALENQGIEARIAAVQRLGAIQEEQAKRALIPIQGRQESGQNKALDQQAAYITAISTADEKALAAEKSRLQQRLALTAQETVAVDDQVAHEQKLADLRGEIALKDQQINTRRATAAKDLFVLDVKNNHDLAESYNAIFDARQSDLDALNQQLQVQKDQNAAIGLNAQQLDILNTALVEEKANRLEGKAAILDTIVGREEEAEVLRKSAARMRELNTAQIEGARKAADFKAYTEFWDSIDKAAQSAFSNIGDGGKAVLDRLKDSLKSGLLDMLYQLTVKQFIINVKAQVTGDFLSSAASAAASSTGAGSTAGSAAGIIGNVASALNIYKLTSSAGSAITSAGTLFGSSAVSAFGAGLQGGQAAAAYAAYGGQAAAGGLAAGESVASAISAIPGWGWAALGAAAVASYLGVFSGDGPEQHTHLTFGSNNAPGNISINERGNEGRNTSYIDTFGKSAFGTFGVTNSLWSPSDSKAVQSFIQTVSKTDDALASFLTTTEQTNVTAALTGTKTTAQLGAEGTDQNSTGGLDVVFKSRIEAILGAVTPGLDKLVSGFDGTSQALATEAQSILQFRQALDQSGESLFGAKVTLLDIAALRQPTELASAALKRVADEFTATNAVASVLGKTSLEAFGAIGLASEETRKNLITMFGGLGNLSTQTAAFAQNFLTDAERLAPVSAALDTALKSLSLSSIPQTRDQFKTLVQGLDLTTENGQKTFAALMNLQSAFAQVHQGADALAQQRQLDIQLMTAMGNAEGALSAQRADALKALASDQAKATQQQIFAAQDAQNQRQLDIQLMQALGNEEGALAATRKDALASMLSDQARITQAQIYAAQDAKKLFDSLANVADGALSRLVTAINAEKDRINKASTQQEESIRAAAKVSTDSAQKSLEDAQKQVSALKTIFSTLDSALSSNRSESETTMLLRRQAAQSVLAANIADPSKLADNKSLADAIGTISGQSNARLFGTFEEYARDQARTNNALVSLRDSAGSQVDNAEQAVKKLGDTIDAIKLASEKQLQQLQIDTQSQIDKLDQQLAAQNLQLDLLKGIDSSVLSVKAALDAVAQALGNLGKNPTAVGNSAVGIEALYQSILGRHSDAEGLAYYTQALKNGFTLDMIRNEFLNSPEYQKLHPQSPPVVKSIAQDHLSALMGRVSDPVQNSTTLLAELQRLNTLTENQQTTLDAIAAATGLTGDVLDRAQKGQPLATTSEG